MQKITRRFFISSLVGFFGTGLFYIQSKTWANESKQKEGFLIVIKSSGIKTLYDIKEGRHRLGAGDLGIAFMKEKINNPGIKYVKLPLSEIYIAFQHGIIDGLVYLSDGTVSPEAFSDRFLRGLNVRSVPLKF